MAVKKEKIVNNWLVWTLKGQTGICLMRHFTESTALVKFCKVHRIVNKESHLNTVSFSQVTWERIEVDEMFPFSKRKEECSGKLFLNTSL